MDRHVADATGRGAQVLAGGARAPGYGTPLFYQPTVLDGVPIDALVNREETFGPIAPIVRLPDDDSILEAANRGGHGLVAAVFMGSIKRAFRMAERLETGSVVVNDTSTTGSCTCLLEVGRLGGRHTLEEFTQLKTISFDVSR